MSEAIWKYPLEITDQQELTLPAGARVLCVQVQRGDPCLWALCDKDAAVAEKRKVLIFGTGHEIKDSGALRYIGTFQVHNGDFVGHVFEERF